MIYWLHLFMVFFVIFETIRFYGIQYDSSDPREFIPAFYKAARLSKVEVLNDTLFDQCKLQPSLTWTEELRSLLNPHYNPLLSCNRSFQPWSALDSEGRVQIRSEFNEALCRARALKFKDEYRNAVGEWHAVSEQFVFENDIVEVECKVDENVVYRFVHSQIWTGAKSKSNVINKTSNVTTENRPSVYIIILDSMGASHIKRVFPRTLQFLKEKFGSVDMQYLNKIGENSRPNAFPFLLGKTVQDIYRDLWGLENITPDLNMTKYCFEYLDNEPFIMKEFGKRGYTTMMAEDWALGVFNWPTCKGYENPPATHYMRPFQLAVDPSSKYQGKDNCFEPHHFLNNYTDQFIKAYPDSPKFALNWASYLTHDVPHDSFHADSEYLDFFQNNEEELDNSFVFFMGDHGLRWGKILDTAQGRRDMNNPMLHISVPRKLRSDPILMDNLRKNSKEMLTLFDLHATFVDILETFTASFTPDFSYTVQKNHLRGTSLLRPLPTFIRNCKTLPIPFEYCLCQIEKKEIGITKEFFGIEKLIADAINEQLERYNLLRSCARMKPDRLTHVRHISGTTDLYEVTVRMKTNRGIYQAIVRGSQGTFRTISTGVTRLDEYSSQAYCIKNNELRPLCYCPESEMPPSFFEKLFN